jgi:flavin-dependent dehydrogenase
MNSAPDLLVVGGGPAGTAAAIWAALAGLRVRLFERSVYPRHRPGETLHPGLGTLFRQLGVEARVSAASALRPEAIEVEWSGRRSRQAFGADSDDAWRGYQVAREVLDSILLERAREVGIEIAQPVAAGAPVVRRGRVAGVRAGSAEMAARFVVDATGAAGWLRRHLRLEREVVSPPLRVYYGYCEGHLPSLADAPSMNGDDAGWTWTAQIAPRRLHWTRLALDGRRAAEPPESMASLPRIGRVRGADTTWRHVRPAAGPGYFLVGDAAIVLDPAAASGVLRALMSGMMAGHTIARILAGRTSEAQGCADYRRWMKAWFDNDVGHLSDLYRQLDPSWNT